MRIIQMRYCKAKEAANLSYIQVFLRVQWTQNVLTRTSDTGGGGAWGAMIIPVFNFYDKLTMFCRGKVNHQRLSPHFSNLVGGRGLFTFTRVRKTLKGIGG